MAAAAHTEQSPSPSPARRWLARGVRAGIGVLLLLLAANIIHITLAGNVHTVIPGRLYRGAQPSGASLEGLIQRYHLRTVINVRGCCFPDDWFVDEAEVCQRLGVHMEDVSFSAVHLPSRDELRQLVEVLDRAEYPAFLHCRHGADRTGLASMVALLLHNENTYASARRQLSLFYGHIPIGKTTMLDRFFDLYESWLARSGQEHSSSRFRHWLLEEYRGGWCDAQFIEVCRVTETPRVGEPVSYRVKVRNSSQADWEFRAMKNAGYHVTFKVMNEDEHVLCEDRAGLLDKTVKPGETIEVMMIVPPIQKAGHYRLYVDMIEEGHCWFHQSGSELWEEELAIRE